MGTLTFTINGVFSVKYKLEEEGERKRREKVDLDLKITGKGCRMQRMHKKCDYKGYIKTSR